MPEQGDPRSSLQVILQRVTIMQPIQRVMAHEEVHDSVLARRKRLLPADDEPVGVLVAGGGSPREAMALQLNQPVASLSKLCFQYSNPGFCSLRGVAASEFDVPSERPVERLEGFRVIVKPEHLVLQFALRCVAGS